MGLGEGGEGGKESRGTVTLDSEPSPGPAALGKKGGVVVARQGNLS